MPEELLTVQDVAKWLRVNPQTVRHWIDREELAAIHVGARRVRIRRSEVNRFLAAGETRATVHPAKSSDLDGAMTEVVRARDTSEMWRRCTHWPPLRSGSPTRSKVTASTRCFRSLRSS
jgi:excisionase family DNA binding protein